MQDQSLGTWIFANAVALGIGFPAALQVGMLIAYGFNTEMYWTFTPPGQTTSAYAAELLSSVVLGVFLGPGQALVLGSRLPRAMPWILWTAVGFGLTAVVAWPLMVAQLWGNLPGPVEPIVLLVGGGALAGMLQYRFLRQHGIQARRWLTLWIIGLVVSLVPTTLLFMSFDALGVSVNWPTEAFLNGVVVAGVAAWISGKALLASFAAAGSRAPA